MKTLKRLAQVALFLVFASAGYVFWTYPVASSDLESAPALEHSPPEMKKDAPKTNHTEAKVSTSEGAWPAETTEKMQILAEIFAAKNDNDPRMDKELRTLSEEDKKALRQTYKKLPLENRNERGTIVFLIGRNLNTKEDYAFLKEVLLEAPCLSLENCFQNPPGNTESPDHQNHIGNGLALVLDYPQVTALKAMEKHPAPTPELKTIENDLLHMAASSRSSLVSELATEIKSSRE